MLADDTENRSDATATCGERVGAGIREHEIVQIAVFKLRECASRLETLATVDPGSPLTEELRHIGAELRRREIMLLRYPKE